MESKNKVRCRFAPAPTGSLHLGSVHTALFTWLFARHNEGEFWVRLEDSDQVVSSPTAIDSIIEDLKWLGIMDDSTEIHYQSKRYEAGIYHAALKKLWSKGLLREKMGAEGAALEYRPPEKKIVVKDSLRRPFEVAYSDLPESQLSPFIIMRADGWPLYNFACVVDDIDMGITHVIRGDDILSSTAKQISLYNALEAPVPVFTHLPKVLAEDGKPLAKRRGSKSIEQYRKEGFLLEGILNYLALLSWSSPSKEEILTMEQVIREFDLDQVGTSPVRLDPAKLLHVNAAHIRAIDPTELVRRLLEYLGSEDNHPEQSHIWLERFCKEYAPRTHTLAELANKLFPYEKDLLEYDTKLLEKHVVFPEAGDVLMTCSSLLRQGMVISDDIINTMRDAAAEMGISFKRLAQCVRIALLNSAETPDLVALLWLVGIEKAQRRLRHCAELVKSLNWKWLTLLDSLREHCNDVIKEISKVREVSKSIDDQEHKLVRDVLGTLSAHLSAVESDLRSARLRALRSSQNR